MKKYFCVMLIIILVSNLCGCNKNTEAKVDRIDGHYGYDEYSFDIPILEDMYAEVRSILQYENEYFISVLYHDKNYECVKTEVFHLNSDGENVGGFSLEGNQIPNCIIDDKLAFLSTDNSIVLLDPQNGSLLNVYEGIFPEAFNLINCEDGFVVIGNGRIDKYNSKGKKLGSCEDSILYSMIDLNSYFELEGDSYIVAYNNGIQYYQISFDGKPSKLICDGEENGISLFSCKGQYVVDDLGLYKIDVQEDRLTTLAVWDEINMRPEKKSLRTMPDMYLLDDEHFSKVYEYNDGTAEVFLYKYNDVIDYSEYKVITIGGYDVASDLTVKWITYLYNSTSTEYRIKLIDYSLDFPWATGEEAMNSKLELLKYFNEGNAPDIFYGESFDYYNWGNSGMVQDILPFILADNEFDMKSVTPSIESLLLKNNHCYQLFSSYSLYGYWGKSEVFIENDVDFQELIESFNQSYWGATCSTDIAEEIVRYSIMKNQMCIFSEAELEKVVNFAISNGLSSDSYMYVESNDFNSVIDGEYLLSLAMIGDIYSYSSRFDKEESSLKYVGFPSFGESSNVIIPSGLIAMSSSTEYPNECWNIMKLIMSDEVQMSVAMNQSIPISQKVLDEVIYCAQNPENDKTINSPYYSLVKNKDIVTEMKVEDYVDAINSVDTILLYDWGMYVIICEEIDSYYLMDKPLDKIAESMYDRLNLYIDENYY